MSGADDLEVLAALCVDAVAPVLRPQLADVDERGRPAWPGPVPAGDGPASDDTVWIAAPVVGAVAHRWEPVTCPDAPDRRGGWMMPAHKAAQWFAVTWCGRCWSGGCA